LVEVMVAAEVVALKQVDLVVVVVDVPLGL
jgi:hypothetical protein